MSRPLAIDIDGTMTRPNGGVDPRLFDSLREWDDIVLLATGKSFPYPVALAAFIGCKEIVIAENGGVVLVEDVWHSALLLGGALLSVAVHYVMMQAEFLAAMQILVYVGGVLILVTFAVMLTRSDTETEVNSA